MGKGEIAHHEQFLLFPWCIQRTSNESLFGREVSSESFLNCEFFLACQCFQFGRDWKFVTNIFSYNVFCSNRDNFILIIHKLFCLGWLDETKVLSFVIKEILTDFFFHQGDWRLSTKTDPNGLVSGHAYTITGIEKVNLAVIIRKKICVYKWAIL